MDFAGAGFVACCTGGLDDGNRDCERVLARTVWFSWSCFCAAARNMAAWVYVRFDSSVVAVRKGSEARPREYVDV